jgi:uncharacterized protein (DUF1684 family)
VNTQDLLDARRQKDNFYKNHPQSPLTPEQQAAFTGLRYYPPNPELDLIVTVEPIPDKKPVSILTNTGEAREYTHYGRFTFGMTGRKRR